MTLTLDLPPDMEEALRRDAERLQTTPERAVLDGLRRLYPPTPGADAPGVNPTTGYDPTLSPQERLRLFQELVASFASGEAGGPLLSDEALTREAIYGPDPDPTDGP